MPAKKTSIFPVAIRFVFLGFLIAAIPAHSQVQVLHIFDNADGLEVNAGLVFDSTGNLYGTAYYGGGHGWGDAFELRRGKNGKWTETLLHSFNLKRDSDEGALPASSLTLDADGNVYGTTVSGGIPCEAAYCGTVFKLTRGTDGKWTETILHVFSFSDGAEPYGALIFDKAGNLYGTTYGGGTGTACNLFENCGTVFKMTRGANGRWTETVLYNFSGGSDGSNPLGGVVFDKAGNLYGTTFGGGNLSCGGSCGVVFKSAAGANGQWTETVIHAFNGKDGSRPSAALIFDKSGNLYGTTPNGGDPSCKFGCGNVFELVPVKNGQWRETVLHSFSINEGWNSGASLLFDAKGNLYGTTHYGGNPTCPPYGCGTVFKLTPGAKGQWTEAAHYYFNGKNGFEPCAALILDPAGDLYSTTDFGGNYGTDVCGGNGCGVVFKITP